MGYGGAVEKKVVRGKTAEHEVTFLYGQASTNSEEPILQNAPPTQATENYLFKALAYFLKLTVVP